MTTRIKAKPDRSDRSERVYDFLQRYIAEHGWAPSIREIQQACQISSTSVARYQLLRLEKAGRIRRGPFNSIRTILLVEQVAA